MILPNSFITGWVMSAIAPSSFNFSAKVTIYSKRYYISVLFIAAYPNVIWTHRLGGNHSISTILLLCRSHGNELHQAWKDNSARFFPFHLFKYIQAQLPSASTSVLYLHFVREQVKIVMHYCLQYKFTDTHLLAEILVLLCVAPAIAAIVYSIRTKRFWL